MNKKIAIVTGVGRIKGIGRAICIELAKSGFDIFFTYWRVYDQKMPWKVELDEPANIQQEILDFGRQCISLEIDFSKKGIAKKVLDEVHKSLGSPQVLINNATYSTQTTIADYTDEELDKHYHVNVRATTSLTIEFIRRFSFDKGGRIVNLTSGQSLGPMPEEIAYAITKGSIEILTKTLYQEIAAKGITINAVNPGPNDTGWMNDDIKEQILPLFPMNRVGVPSDTANLIGFLVSDQAEWITGQVIHSEGGFKR